MKSLKQNDNTTRYYIMLLLKVTFWAKIGSIQARFRKPYLPWRADTTMQQSEIPYVVRWQDICSKTVATEY